MTSLTEDTLRACAVLLLMVGSLALITAMMSIWVRFIDQSDVPQTRFSAFDHGNELFWHYVAINGGTWVLSMYAGVRVYLSSPESLLKMDELMLMVSAPATVMVLLHADKAWFFLGIVCSSIIGAYGSATISAAIELWDWAFDNYGRQVTRQRRRRRHRTRLAGSPVPDGPIDSYNLVDDDDTSFSIPTQRHASHPEPDSVLDLPHSGQSEPAFGL